ncbi:MAG: GNAT family N-acetyltransferase [Bdellovibrionales bacterium]|nr:GNAT family N-acetyltransferase [Bdellovibrionales bacterium]
MDISANEQIVNISADMQLSVRLARDSDIPAIAHVMKSCADWLEGEGYTHWKVYQSGPKCEEDVANGKVYCAFGADRTLIATFTIAHESPPYAKGIFEDHWEVPDATARFFKKLAVLPNFHGNGIGKGLLQEAERISRKQGATYMRLDINPGIPWLGDYYRELGFEQRAELAAGVIFEKAL